MTSAKVALAAILEICLNKALIATISIGNFEVPFMAISPPWLQPVTEISTPRVAWKFQRVMCAKQLSPSSNVNRKPYEIFDRVVMCKLKPIVLYCSQFIWVQFVWLPDFQPISAVSTAYVRRVVLFLQQFVKPMEEPIAKFTRILGKLQLPHLVNLFTFRSC